MDLVGKRWTLPIILELYKYKGAGVRYNSIKKSIPEITSRVLSMRLKELEEKKLLFNKVDTTVSPTSSTYYLTPSGRDFMNVIAEMKLWSLKWAYKNKICEETNCAECKEK